MNQNILEADTADVGEVCLDPHECVELITGAYLSDKYERTLCFVGPPGVGKTSSVKEAADNLRVLYPDFQYVEINPTMPHDEVGGIPDLVRKEGQATKTDYALPKWFVSAEENPDYRAIWCLDDALQGDRMMQQTLANLILARNLRGHAIPVGVMIVVTGNRKEDKAGVSATLTHLADRMCWVTVKPSALAWLDWAVQNNINPKVTAYIKWDESRLNRFNPNVTKSPTSRTWAAVSNWVDYLETLTAGPSRVKLAQVLYAGELGSGEASCFSAFCDRCDKLPNMDELIANPSTHTIDYTMDVQYAITMNLAQKMTAENFPAALEYVARLGPEFVSIAMQVGTKAKPEFRNCKAWTKWLLENQSVIR